MCAMMPLLPLYLTRSRPYLKLCRGLVRVWESLEERDGRAKSEDRARNRWPNCKLVQSRAPSFMWAAAANRLVAPSDRSKPLLPLLQMNSVQRSVAVADSAGLHSYSSFSVLFLFSLLISATRARPTIEYSALRLWVYVHQVIAFSSFLSLYSPLLYLMRYASFS
jgi:hypothetical protein